MDILNTLTILNTLKVILHIIFGTFGVRMAQLTRMLMALAMFVQVSNGTAPFQRRDTAPTISLISEVDKVNSDIQRH